MTDKIVGPKFKRILDRRAAIWKIMKSAERAEQAILDLK